MKPKQIFISLGLFLICISGYTQVTISDDGAADPDPASVLDLQSTTKGFLTPRMTEAQKNAIVEPPTGLIIFQTDGTAGFYFNAGTSAIPDWTQIADETTTSGGTSGYWIESGSDIYYTGGNVGIGTATPGTTLDVAGPGWFNDSIAVDGNAGGLFLNTGTSYEPTIRFAQDNSTIFRLIARNAGGSLPEPYFMLNSDIHTDIWGVTKWGRVRQDYRGSYQAFLLYSSAPRSAFFVDNDNLQDEARCINATLSNNSASVNSITVSAWNSGEGSALYGENDNYNNYGYIGTDTYGIYGGNTSGYWGAIGTATSGVYGKLGDAPQSITDGDFAVKGIGVATSSQSGSAYTYNATIGGGLGYNQVGTPYSFGMAGYTTNVASISSRTGGVYGSFSDASAWGSLAFIDNGGTAYAGYFTSSTGTGSGKAMGGTFSSIGLGAWGDLMGASIHGDIYGLYTEGENYSLYANGDVYRSGADVHIQTNTNGENSVMYTLVSTDMVVQTYGIGQLQKGKSSIVFDQAFAEVVSAEEPVIVTITPIGKSKGVYLEEVDGAGFSVAENDRGKSNVQFSWIAIGKRKGYENNQLPQDVIAADYTEKIHRGIANDNNAEASAEGIYYQDGQLQNGHVSGQQTGGATSIKAPEQAKPSQEQEIAEDIKADIEK